MIVIFSTGSEFCISTLIGRGGEGRGKTGHDGHKSNRKGITKRNVSTHTLPIEDVLESFRWKCCTLMMVATVGKNTRKCYTVVGRERKSQKLNHSFVLPGTNCPLCVDDTFYI